MKTTKMFQIFLTVLSFLLYVPAVYAQQIEATVTNMRASQGQIIIKVFKDEKSFKDDKPSSIRNFKKTNVVNGQMTITFSLEPGTYGLALVDDENSDGEMNFNFLGMPKEGFGFSNYVHKGMLYPKFDAFRFSLVAQARQKVTMKVTYM